MSVLNLQSRNVGTLCGEIGAEHLRLEAHSHAVPSSGVVWEHSQSLCADSLGPSIVLHKLVLHHHALHAGAVV